MELNNIIFEKRKEKGLSQEQLANELNIARQTISKWETGETLPDVENLRKLAILLEFSIDEVLGIEVEKEDDSSEWFIIAGFVIGNSLGLIINKPILGFAFAMVAFGTGIIINKLRKK